MCLPGAICTFEIRWFVVPKQTIGVNKYVFLNYYSLLVSFLFLFSCNTLQNWRRDKWWLWWLNIWITLYLVCFRHLLLCLIVLSTLVTFLHISICWNVTLAIEQHKSYSNHGDSYSPTFYEVSSVVCMN